MNIYISICEWMKNKTIIFSTEMLNNLQLLKHRTNHNKKHMFNSSHI